MQETPGFSPLPDSLFETYLQTNAMIPQYSDGIKWGVHHAYLINQPIDVIHMASVQFTEEQLTTLKIKVNALHRVSNVPFLAQVPGQDIPSHFSVIPDDDLQLLIRRVRHSLVNNLFNYERHTKGEDTGDYESDIDHDKQPPTEKMITAVSNFIANDGEDLGLYKQLLGAIVGVIHSEAGRSVLLDYRNEFVGGKRLSTVWKVDGYGEQFAHLVGKDFDKQGVDRSDSRVQYFLHINNMTGYSEFPQRTN